MSFDLDVLAVDLNLDDDHVRAMVQRCRSNSHPEGELDERIVSLRDAACGLAAETTGDLE